ncbi:MULTISPECIES: hypothetical protein [Enterobacteriaceae]|uniref:hypothetical protein n=1 Tax=Enterobacteriaceae TaxID=543 RepID=UPI000DA45BBB|nr:MULTISPECIES: hypothetical protein [Enterobacteriaceae]EHX5858027.1 hypothetical protein [Escherichia coli]MBJ8979158.1 hypothetical protein [Citrobacter freundii]MBJ9016057.1 hypothetical protein [Citrobacter freundii]SQM17947.1 Uncharacterised protein [Escherichia coli]SQN27965.1 Uncharacterised protein [Escherichia coli]
MLNKLLFLLMKALNSSPLFHISADDNFDTIEKNNFSVGQEFRLTFLALSFGTIKIYLITCTFIANPFKWKGISLSYQISFDTVQKRKSPSILEAQMTEYENVTLKNIDDEKRAKQEEFLKLRTAENNDSLNSIFNKVNYHTTIILAYAAVLVYAYTKLIELPITATTTLIYYLAITNLLNMFDLMFLLKRIVSISDFTRSTFKELRSCNEKYSLAKSLYFDWAASTDDVKYFAGLAKNSEIISMRIIFIGMIVLASTTLFPEQTKNSQQGTSVFLQSIAFINHMTEEG